MHVRESGATLVGELLALAIIGSVIVIMLSGLSTSSAGVAIVRQRVTAENYARQQMEMIKAAAYRVDPTAVPYPSVALTSSYTMTVGIRYWISPTFTITVPTAELDQGLQEVTVSVASSRAPETSLFVLQGYKGNRP